MSSHPADRTSKQSKNLNSQIDCFRRELKDPDLGIFEMEKD
jgi:hypothetical protein